MSGPSTLPAFDGAQTLKVHRLLATRVAQMMGRKLEEGDWIEAYCLAKDIPSQGWSNLHIDVNWRGLGLEHKMLSRPSDRPLIEACGTTLMHPSLTRSIRIPEGQDNPRAVMQTVFAQYADLLAAREASVKEAWPGLKPDMRTGWLLWRTDLREFIYFEEQTTAPVPEYYDAEWHETEGRGRKSSRNLWVFEKATGRKRYSVTTAAGAKIQPYFDVPPPGDPNLYHFQVQGERVGDAEVRIWVTAATFRELTRILDGNVSASSVSAAIGRAASEAKPIEVATSPLAEEAVPITVTGEAYDLLTAAFPGVSDEHMFQLFLKQLAASS